MQYAICPVADLSPEIGIAALVENEQVALFKLNDGQIFAVSNFDPFSQANIMSRGLTGELKGQKVVASPMYKQHFNLQTGQCLEDPSVALKTYTVLVQNQYVYVTLSTVSSPQQ